MNVYTIDMRIRVDDTKAKFYRVSVTGSTLITQYGTFTPWGATDRDLAQYPIRSTNGTTKVKILDNPEQAADTALSIVADKVADGFNVTSGLKTFSLADAITQCAYPQMYQSERVERETSPAKLSVIITKSENENVAKSLLAVLQLVEVSKRIPSALVVDEGTHPVVAKTISRLLVSMVSV